MTFEAGPWHCFGNELLVRLIQIIDQQNQQQKHPPLAEPTPQTKNLKVGGGGRGSRGALALPPTGPGSISMPSGAAATTTTTQPFDFDVKKITFVPDYSAVIRDD